MTTTTLTLRRRPLVRPHRGDCLDVLRKIPPESIDAVICDPPYGIAYTNKKAARKDAIPNDERPFIWWLHDARRVMKPTAALVCFCRWDVQETFRSCIELAGLKVRSQWVWDRRQHGMGDTARTLAPRHDVMWFATRERFTFPAGRPTSVIACASVPGAKRLHPTEKPADLMRRIARDVTPPGGTILDPCMGSGATGECARDGFGFIGIELTRRWFDAAKQRMRRVIAARQAGSV